MSDASGPWLGRGGPTNSDLWSVHSRVVPGIIRPSGSSLRVPRRYGFWPTRLFRELIRYDFVASGWCTRADGLEFWSAAELLPEGQLDGGHIRVP